MMRDRERDQRTETRLDLLRENDPTRTFTANARLLALPTSGDDTDDLENRLDTLCSVFDTIDGPYYEIEGERFREHAVIARTSNRRAQDELDRFRSRTIAVRRRDGFPRLTNRSESRPDLVLNSDELANLIVVLSSTDLTIEGTRGARAEQQSRNPLPRPDHDTARQLRTPGLELGYLLDENREPEDKPLRLSPDLLPFHVGRFAKTGAGKSIALINDALSLYEQASGPVFIIDTKGGGLPEHYMRAHGKRFGFEDLEDHVIHFDIPERLPGFAFFNIEPALADGLDADAIGSYLAEPHPTGMLVEPDPIPIGCSREEIRTEYLDFRPHEASFEVSREFAVTAYRTLWFWLQFEGEPVGNGALPTVRWYDGEPGGDGSLRGQFQGLTDVVDNMVDRGVLSESIARRYMLEKLAAWMRGRQELVIPTATSPSSGSKNPTK